MTLLESFVAHVRDRRLLPEAARVLVACSGGADSTALTLLLHEARKDLRLGAVTLAHLDHGLRETSADEARSVAAWAGDSLGVESVVERRPVSPQPGESPEEAARRVRYAFFEAAAGATGSSHVVTAHHADDQAETVLQRILRGTGATGLAGIPEQRTLTESATLVRPLLPFRRDALRAWLRERGTPWIEDATNVDGNERARIRHVGLPALAECVGRDPIPLLARLATNFAEAPRPTDVELARPFLELDGPTLRIHPGFERLPTTLRAAILRDTVPALRDARPLTRAETERLVEAISGADAGVVSGVRVAQSTSGVQLVSAPPSATRSPRTPLPPRNVMRSGTTELWDGWRISLRVADAANEPFLERLARSDGTLELADADRVEGALVARTRIEGDRLRGLGAAADTRLGHLLQRRGIEASARDRLPLLCDTTGIVWVMGVALADRVRVTPSTRRILLLESIND